MKNKMSKQTQEQVQLQAQLQFLDNGVHRLIIALERLEGYLTLKEETPTINMQTAVKTERDLHDDVSNPPTEEGFYSELHLQALNIGKQGRFSNNMEMINSSASYFFKDILEWYGLRSNCQPNDIERFAVPIIVAISDKTIDSEEITSLIYQYVRDLDNDLQRKSEEEKRKAIEEGLGAWLKAQQKVDEQMREFVKGDMQVKLTSHKRANAKDGFNHLMSSFELLYPEDKTPVLVLQKAVEKLCPSILEEKKDDNTEDNPNNKKI